MEAFRWSSATGMVVLDSFPAGFVESVAYAVSPLGLAVVGEGLPPGSGQDAFRWTRATGPVVLP